LLQHFGQSPVQDRLSLHGPKICKVLMHGGPDVLARAGSMIAYEGLIDFNPNPPQLGQMARSWATGEGVPLMNCTGQGNLFLADYGKDVVIMQLNNEALSVNGKNILAFDATLQWNIERVQGVSMLSGMGMFNVVLRGQGWVALTSKAEGLRIKTKRTARLGGLFGRGSGEAFQLGFLGHGFVVVQPSEDERPRMSVRG
jgi:uncharacterized protein (AIM24 family)